MEQARKYTAAFDRNGCPVAIFSVPVSGCIVEEKAMEIPAPARRVMLVAEAHKMGHFGADKTAHRIKESGFDWLGLSQD